LCNDNVKRIFGDGFSGYEPLASRSLRYALFAPYYLEYELYLTSDNYKKSIVAVLEKRKEPPKTIEECVGWLPL